MLPLQGLKVLDFSHAADGPMCGFMPSIAGTDVIKVEPLPGEHNVEILLEPGYRKDKIDALMRNGIILERPE